MIFDNVGCFYQDGIVKYDGSSSHTMAQIEKTKRKKEYFLHQDTESLARLVDLAGSLLIEN
jgi:hypothetical protein